MFRPMYQTVRSTQYSQVKNSAEGGIRNSLHQLSTLKLSVHFEISATRSCCSKWLVVCLLIGSVSLCRLICIQYKT